MLFETGHFEREEFFRTDGNATAAAGAFFAGQDWGKLDTFHGWLTEWEFQLFPVAALDFRPGVVAGADGNEGLGRLFTGAAAGKAEGVGIGLLFHMAAPPVGKGSAGTSDNRPGLFVLEIQEIFFIQPLLSASFPVWMPVSVSYSFLVSAPTPPSPTVRASAL